jgi:hypothetical protein
MTKRNTRVDDAELSPDEQTKLAAVMSVRPNHSKPKTLGQAVSESLGELLGNGKPSAAPVAKVPAQPKPKTKAKALPPEVLKARDECERLTATIERLQSRLFRTVNALQKLEKRRRYWQKKTAPQV